jgi:hypothetical protein
MHRHNATLQTMPSEEEINSYLKSFKLLGHESICDRSKEIYRKSLTACPSLDIHERCRIFVCIEIACLEYPFLFIDMCVIIQSFLGRNSRLIGLLR